MIKKMYKTLRKSIFPQINLVICKLSPLSSLKKKYTSYIDGLKNVVDVEPLINNFPDDLAFKILKYLNGFNVINNISLVNRYYYRLIFLSNSGNINLLKTLVKQDYKEEVDVKLWTDKKVDVKLCTDKKQSRSNILAIYEYYYSTIYYDKYYESEDTIFSYDKYNENFLGKLLDSSPIEIFVHWFFVVNYLLTSKVDQEILDFVWLNAEYDKQIVEYLSHFAGIINTQNSTEHTISRIFVDYFIKNSTLGYEMYLYFSRKKCNWKILCFIS